MFTRILVTCNREKETSLVYTGTKILDANKVSKSGGDICPFQEVLAVGGSVRNVKPGDIVCINIGHFAVKKYAEGDFRDGIQSMDNKTINFRIPVVEVNDETLMYIDEADVDYVVTDYE